MDAALDESPGLGRRALSAAQVPIWRAEMLHRSTPRWTQITVISMHGKLDPERMVRAVDTIIARHPALRTQLRRRGRDVWQEFTASGIHLIVTERPTAPEARPAAAEAFLAEASRRRFPLYDSPLFHPELLILAPEASVLALSLHHVAADGVALASFSPQIAAAYRDDNGAAGEDHAYEQWLDRQAGADSAPGIASARRFYEQALDDLAVVQPGLYDRAPGEAPLDPPDLPEVGCTLPIEVSNALRTLARANRATPFIVLMAAFAAALRSFLNSSDLLIGTFASGRQGEAGPIVGSCINTLLVPLRLHDCETSRDYIMATREAWRPVRQHQSTAFSLVAGAGEHSLPMPQFAVNYLDMSEIPFEIPGVEATVTHGQQGFPLNDVLLYALREQDGRLRLRLIVGSGTRSISPGRLVDIIDAVRSTLTSWALPEGGNA